MKPRRDAFPSLSAVLEDSARHPATPPIPVALPTHVPAASGAEQRLHTRFDKAFLVVIGSELYGDAFAIARNVSAGGILVEMSYAPPLGSIVTVHFQLQRPAGPADGEPELGGLDEIVARAEVKHHHYLNFTGAGEAASSRAIGMRFIEFLDQGDAIAADRVH